MAQDLFEPMTEAIYDAAVDPRGWATVLSLLNRQFSTAAGIYSLDYARRRARPIEVCGISQGFLRSFDASFFTDDNPSTRAAGLHRPGVIRTDARLGEYFRDHEILQRSRYYNEWLRPQGFRHTMGMTPIAEGDVVFNVTLLRPAEDGAFRPPEIARFKRLHNHLRRALGIALRLETLTQDRRVTAEALDCLPHAVTIVDAHRRLLHCNAPAESLLRQGDALAVRSQRLTARDARTQERLCALLRRLDDGPARTAQGGGETLAVPRGAGRRALVLSALPLAAQPLGLAEGRKAVLVMIVDPERRTAVSAAPLRDLYRLTPAEARLAEALLAGESLKQAAARAAMSYETARWYLKILFQKTGTHRQAELVARLLRDLAAGAGIAARDRGSAE